MKKDWIIALLCSVSMVLLFGVYYHWKMENESRVESVKVGFVYVGDEGNAYTGNFIKAQRDIVEEFNDSVEICTRENVSEGTEEKSLRELIDEGCDIIFATSYGYGQTVKKLAQEYPNIQFCQATCSDANEEPVLGNYHTFMGHIYEGRYVSGVVAGIKLKELIDNGEITSEEAKIGYVAAFPYAEVISGYTAFLLGVRKVVPEAMMEVRYTNTWGNYAIEKKVAKKLIEDGCVIISQHSDTAGPAVACEEENGEHVVYHVGYNTSMIDVAPTTSLISSRINWSPYMVGAVRAMFEEKKIESVVEGTVNGNDVGAGFKMKWVQMLGLNETILPEGTKQKMEEIIAGLDGNASEIYKGNYIGVNPFDENDTYDLSNGYNENANCSAPMFNYVLKDIIKVK